MTSVSRSTCLLPALAALAALATGCGGGQGFMEGNALDSGPASDTESETNTNQQDPDGPGKIMGFWQEPDPGARFMQFTDDGQVALAGSLAELDAGAPDTMRWLMDDSTQSLTLVSLTGICTASSDLVLGTYTFEVTHKYLTLTPVTEPCADRATIGGETWDRVDMDAGVAP